MQNTVGQPQSVQVPNYSGVNIQIFNPSVAAPGGMLPTQSINAPNYSMNPTTSYPANYYTQNYAAPMQTPAPVFATPNSTTQKELISTQTPAPAVVTSTPGPAVVASTPTPAVVPATTPDAKKTEKREIVELTDDYIKNLENYLNSQNSEIRLMGAKEILARLQEDDSRKNDAALNSLVNKMLQDPSQKVKFIAMAILESRLALGDNFSVQLLQRMQQEKTNYGEDALKASNILLKMAGNTVQKEFEVKDKPQKQEKK